MSCTDVSKDTPIYDETLDECRSCTIEQDGGIFWENGKCVPQCKEWHNEQNICESCFVHDVYNPVWYNGNCTTCSEVDYNRPVWSTDKGECISCSEKDIKKPAWVDGHCTSCPSPAALYDPISKQCVPQCPDELPYSDTDKICSDCPAGIPFWTGEGCAKSCPEYFDANLICHWCRELDESYPVWRDGQCSACQDSDGGKLWDAETLKCVSECPAERPKVSGNNVCKACGYDGSANKYWSDERKDCVDRCPESWTEINHCAYCKDLSIITPAWNYDEC